MESQPQNLTFGNDPENFYIYESLTKQIKRPVCQLKTQISLGINRPF